MLKQFTRSPLAAALIGAVILGWFAAAWVWRGHFEQEWVGVFWLVAGISVGLIAAYLTNKGLSTASAFGYALFGPLMGLLAPWLSSAGVHKWPSSLSAGVSQGLVCAATLSLVLGARYFAFVRFGERRMSVWGSESGRFEDPDAGKPAPRAFWIIVWVLMFIVLASASWYLVVGSR